MFSWYVRTRSLLILCLSCRYVLVVQDLEYAPLLCYVYACSALSRIFAGVARLLKQLFFRRSWKKATLNHVPSLTRVEVFFSLVF